MTRLLASVATVFFLLAQAENTSLSTVNAAPPDEPKYETRKFEGVWKPQSAVLGGTTLPTSAVNAITLTISSAEYEVHIDGEKKSDKGAFSFDADARPKRMTIKSTSGPNRGQHLAMATCRRTNGSCVPAPSFSAAGLSGFQHCVTRRGCMWRSQQPPSCFFIVLFEFHCAAYATANALTGRCPSPHRGGSLPKNPPTSLHRPRRLSCTHFDSTLLKSSFSESPARSLARE